VKLGGAVSQWIVGLLLSLTGYLPNQEQPDSAVKGILILASLIPGACALISAVVIQVYRLDAGKLDVIQRELQERRIARGEV